MIEPLPIVLRNAAAWLDVLDGLWGRLAAAHHVHADARSEYQAVLRLLAVWLEEHPEVSDAVGALLAAEE